MYNEAVVRLIEQNRPRIEELCRQCHVKRLELFGSAVRADFDVDSSDFDFLVEFEELEGFTGASGQFFNLLHGLEDLLGRHIDLVERAAVTNPYFLPVADRHLELLYAA